MGEKYVVDSKWAANLMDRLGKGKWLQEVLPLPNMAVCLLWPFQEMRNMVYFGVLDQLNQNKINVANIILNKSSTS